MPTSSCCPSRSTRSTCRAISGSYTRRRPRWHKAGHIQQTVTETMSDDGKSRPRTQQDFAEERSHKDTEAPPRNLNVELGIEGVLKPSSLFPICTLRLRVGRLSMPGVTTTAGAAAPVKPFDPWLAPFQPKPER